jgi:hypothetical protein
MSSARQGNERFRERRCGDGAGHCVCKRKEAAILSDAAGIPAGIAAGNTSASEKNERFSERRCTDGGGHVVGKRKKRAIPRAAL